MIGHTCRVLAIAAILAGYTHAELEECSVPAQTDAGYICGLERVADDGTKYASFRGVPYAKQPVGELRFKELEPQEPWSGYLETKYEGPICFQTDILYGRLMHKPVMSEACIHANIHVPLDALPKPIRIPSKDLKPPRGTLNDCEDIKFAPSNSSTGLPILVFMHGGGFAFGSGHADVHGPEYLISNNVIVITFNYRLNVFGFLSLNSSTVPGNAGLRDMITMLRWVQRNAKAFGGDPRNVTIAGQSAGSIAAHLLTLSKAAEGLFQRAILMSGIATSGLYSPSQIYAQFITQQLLHLLNINATDPDDIYQQLVKLPAEDLQNANNILIDAIGFTTFVPTVESSFPGVTAVLDDTPDNLIKQGRGEDIPLLVGYTDAECETFRLRLEEFDFVGKSKARPEIIVPAKLLFTTPKASVPVLIKEIDRRYYNGTVSVDGFIKSCTDGFFEYPVMKLVEARENTLEPTATYVYRFSFDYKDSLLKKEKKLNFHGAGHVEDLTYIFKVNSVLGSHTSYPPKTEEDYMKQLMPSFVVNFMYNSKPILDDSKWPSSNTKQFLYEDIEAPNVYQAKRISLRQEENVKFFDNLNIVD